nr:helix-turn-helix transcriptional regulator [Parafrankia sp. EUN1f]
MRLRIYRRLLRRRSAGCGWRTCAGFSACCGGGRYSVSTPALAAERGRTEAWFSAFHLAEERKRLGLTQREVAELMDVSPGRVSQIENGDLDANEVATLSRYARALGVRLRIIFDYGNDLRQIA